MQALFFSIFKYLELFALAVTHLVLAERLGPTQLGLMMPILLFVTYSNYSVVGAPQLILKYLPRKNRQQSIDNLLSSASKLLYMGAVITLLATILFLELKYVLFVFFICISTFVSSYLLAKLRLDGKFTPINAANFISASVLLILTFTYVESVDSYLYSLMISKGLQLTIFFYSDYQFSVKSVKSVFIKIKPTIFCYYTKSALAITMSGLCFTLLMSLDRLVIQFYGFEPRLLGSYQLADTVGTAFYMGMSTILFYFYPMFLDKINSSEVFRIKYLKILFCFSFLPLIISFPIKYIMSNLAVYFFIEYEGLWEIASNIVMLKMFLLIYSSILTYYVSRTKEILGVLITISLIIVCIIESVLFFRGNLYNVSYLPIVFSFTIFTYIIVILSYEYKNK